MGDDLFTPDTSLVRLAEFSKERREKLGKKGKAFKNANDDYSYPINSEQDLKNAIQAFGRAKPEDKPKLKRYIMAKARAMGKADLIPDSWKGVAASAPGDDALVRLASITKVKGYKRRGDKGQSERVNSYVRKVLDAFGGINDKTKKGAFASTDTVDPDAPAAPKVPNTANTPSKPDADKAAADLKADVEDYSGALADALDGKDFEIPKYRTPFPKGQKARLDRKEAKQAFAALQGTTDQDIKDAASAVKHPKVKQLIEKTPVPVIAESVKTMSSNVKKYGRKAFLVSMAVLLSDSERFAAEAEKFQQRYDWADNIANIVSVTIPALMPQIEGFLHMLGLSEEEKMTPDSEVMLSLVTRVEAYKRRGISGKTEHVDSYIRKTLDSFGHGADAATKKAAFMKGVDALKAEKGDIQPHEVDEIAGKVKGASFTKPKSLDAPAPPAKPEPASLKGANIAKDKKLADNFSEPASLKHEIDKWAKTPIPAMNKAQAKPWMDAVPEGTTIFDRAMRQSYVKTSGGWKTGDADGKNPSGPVLKNLASSVGKNPKRYTVNLKKVNLSSSTALAQLEVKLAKGRLDWSPKKNWVENAGGLPKFIEDIALALIRDHGMTREHAIPVAINRVKKWAAGLGDTKPDTKAKAAAALAEWEALKAKSKGKTAAKKAAS